MSQNTSNRNLMIAIALVLLACVRFEYRTVNWEIATPGLRAGTVIVGIIAVVLVFRIFNAVQDACIARGLFKSRVACPYDMLFPIAFVLVMIKGHWTGDLITGMYGRDVYRWEFSWSDADWDVPFLAALIVVLLLLRIQALFKAIEAHATEKAESRTLHED